MSGRPLSWVIGGSTAFVVVIALVAWFVVRDDDTYTAPTPTDRVEQADPAAAGRALARFQKAVTGRDAAAAQALAPVTDAAARLLLGQVVANATALHVGDLAMRYVDEAGPVDAQGRWPAAVDMSWRFDGFDRTSAHEEVVVTFQETRTAGGADTVAISGFGGGDDRSPLWLTTPLEVRRTARSLVLAESAADADRIGRRADRAVAVVRRVLPQWPGRLVVEVPGSEPELDQVLAADPDSYTKIAAVTASVDGTLTPDSEIHVFINPTLYDTLDPVGAQVVLSHEATHDATDAPVKTGLPIWLTEGFADYVALRDVTLPITTTAGQILADVRQSGPPPSLPGTDDFDEHATHLGAAYEAAWLVCRVLADLGGEAALVRLYESVSAGHRFETELRSIFGLSVGQLTQRWQQRLQQLADGSRAPA